MKAFFDTSVLVPVFYGDHVHHLASLELFIQYDKSSGPFDALWSRIKTAPRPAFNGFARTAIASAVIGISIPEGTASGFSTQLKAWQASRGMPPIPP
jgi:hypothetical protein